MDPSRFVIKGGLAGGAVYVAYDQGLLGSGTQGAEAFRKAQAALPPAIQEWISYTGWEVRAVQPHNHVLGMRGREHWVDIGVPVMPVGIVLLKH